MMASIITKMLTWYWEIIRKKGDHNKVNIFMTNTQTK